MLYELVLELGQKVGQLISKSEEKLWDIDIKNFTVSPLDQIKCNSHGQFQMMPRKKQSAKARRKEWEKSDTEQESYESEPEFDDDEEPEDD